MKRKWKITIISCCGVIILLTSFILVQQQKKLSQAQHHISKLEKQLTMTNQKFNQLSKNSNEKDLTLNASKEQIDQLTKEKNNLQNQLNQMKKKRATIESHKKVFLTFDDGPSPLTKQILHILDQKKVKATFFTIGNLMEMYPTIVRDTFDSGHMVLPHSYSHKYSIYTTFETFYKDFSQAMKAYEVVLGQPSPSFFRFPGGSSNHSSFQYGGKQFMPNLTTDLKEKGYYYIDWNVISGDASSISDDPKKMLHQLISGSEGKELIVALFHDITPNKKTAEILPDVIDYYQRNGYTFRTFRDVTEEEINEMIKMGIVNKEIVH